MRHIYTVIVRLIFAAVTCIIVAIIAGGKAFLSQPLGLVYLALLLLWMATIAIGRGTGVHSSYESGQRGIYALLAVIYFIEYPAALLRGWRIIGNIITYLRFGIRYLN